MWDSCAFRAATFQTKIAIIAAKVASKDRHTSKATGDCGLRRLRVGVAPLNNLTGPSWPKTHAGGDSAAFR